MHRGGKRKHDVVGGVKKETSSKRVEISDEDDMDSRMMKYYAKKLGIKDSKTEQKIMALDGLDCTSYYTCIAHPC